MYAEEDLLPISALQHLAFCERQWALIHLENAWADNRLTVEGRQMHERSDEPQTESRGDVRVARGLRLRSLRLGLTGKADIVEFHRQNTDGITLEGVPGGWRPLPVEFKHGQPKIDRCDEVQLCAQALCLEEMLQVKIDEGQIFYGRPRRRHDVRFDDELRGLTEQLAARLQELTREGSTPPPLYDKRCESCSLKDICMPKTMGSGRSILDYLDAEISRAKEENR